MLTGFAENQADNRSSALVDEDLTFEDVPFFLARIEHPLMLLKTLNRRFGDINRHDFWTT
ncbi:hypothetical protein JOY44_20395 [Phormidium sp. CLA17]|uniref:hypothetical protein n=1 Tax=Leptolyngbya sp. Cla-17 TaxID=2803751 RepID=UPI0014925B64|nr:hypothetical protein [Leptolyngbya sp. Cla-17]MBM0743952.1 hypothetical protein [Leptolyngbya sp. Cla-17]